MPCKAAILQGGELLPVNGGCVYSDDAGRIRFLGNRVRPVAMGKALWPLFYFIRPRSGLSGSFKRRALSVYPA